MYDPKFEKAIQQKMEELEFRPAESVWVNIEKAVVADRRRRGAGFWRFLLPGLFIMAAAGIYFYHNTGKTTDGTVKTADGTGKTTDGTVKTTDGAGKTADGTVKTTVAAPAGAGLGRAVRPTTVQGAAVDHQTATVQGAAVDHQTATVQGAAENTQSVLPRMAAITGRGVRRNSTRIDNGRSRNSGVIETAHEAGENTFSASPAPQVSGKAPGAADKAPERFDWFYQPGLVDQRLSPQVHGTALTTKKNSISLTSLERKKYHWEAGFAGGGGLSRLNRLNADQAQAALDPAAQSLYNISGSSSSKHYISETKPGASFDGGIYLQRALSRRWLVNTGLNLHYYSNTISIGQQLSTYVNVAASYLYPTASVAAPSATMYASGNQQSYTNRYYFLELPVGIQWKLSQNRILPVFLEGGVSLSRLMGANALFYNAKTGYYSKDEGDVVNKTQVNISSALLVGLPLRPLRMQVGPQIQYGLTPLINTSGLGDQHFFYAGLRLVVIPGGK